MKTNNLKRTANLVKNKSHKSRFELALRSLMFFTILFLMTLHIQLRTSHSATQPQFPWPLENRRGEHHYSSNFGQYQWRGSRYFHAGIDLMALPGQSVYSPSKGRIEAGYYDYRDLDHGHYYLNKYFLPFKDAISMNGQHGYSDFQFEVAIVTEQGLRLEFHHVNPNTLPEKVVEAILNGGSVDAGDVIGFVSPLDLEEFGIPYDHIHYNIVSPEGIHLNPQYFSLPISDTLPPVIHSIFEGPIAPCKNGIGHTYRKIQPENKVSSVDELLIRVSDKLDGNSIAQAPTRIKIQYQGHDSIEYDFSYSLLDENYNPVDVRQIYQSRFCIVPGIDGPIQSQGSTVSTFFIRIPIPAGYKGELVIEFGDFANNLTRLKMIVEGTSVATM